jgi:predicted ATPase
MSKAPKVEPYVRMVESNVKSPTGDHWKLELGPRTLLVGSNTSHKTAVIQSIELALKAQPMTSLVALR